LTVWEKRIEVQTSADCVRVVVVVVVVVDDDDDYDCDCDYDHNNNDKVETSRGGKVTIMWNQQVQTDRTIPNNKPDIVIRDNEKGSCMLIDIPIPGDRNVIQKEAEKILKYKDITIEIQRVWNVKTRVIPVMIGATGAISKSFRKYVSTIPGNHEIKELQKTAILGTEHILRKVPM
jgi:hypothetical protein